MFGLNQSTANTQLFDSMTLECNEKNYNICSYVLPIKIASKRVFSKHFLTGCELSRQKKVYNHSLDFAIIKNNSFDIVFMRGDSASLKTIMIHC